MRALDINLQLQILKDGVAPVLEFPEPSLGETAYHVGALAKSLPHLHAEQRYPRVAPHLGEHWSRAGNSVVDVDALFTFRISG
jgi:hypothetical protein